MRAKSVPVGPIQNIQVRIAPTWLVKLLLLQTGLNGTEAKRLSVLFIAGHGIWLILLILANTNTA